MWGVTARTKCWVNRFVDCTIEDTKLKREEREAKGEEWLSIYTSCLSALGAAEAAKGFSVGLRQ